jgi:hypothetical protein
VGQELTTNFSTLEQKPDLELQPEVCYFGVREDQDQNEVFGINQNDRKKHVYIIGKTGMGKTSMLQNMVLQDIYNGYGVCYMDPHGDSARYILDRIPKHRHNDVVYINPSDLEYPVGFNILEANQAVYLTASELMAVFGKIWSGLWSSRMEYILNNTLLALLETPGNTLLSVVKMLTDDIFRISIVQRLKDPVVKHFWTQEFANFNQRYRQEAISPILNKIGQFLSSEIIRNILGQQKSTVDLREIMDEGKILIVNLSKGLLGEDNSNLLGALLIAKLQVAALSRADIDDETNRRDFYLYVDEFQNFTNDSFSTILSEARKYGLNLILAHQYIAQLTETGDTKVRNAIFGNVGTMLSFRIGSVDAKQIAQEFSGSFKPNYLVNLDPYEIAVKMQVNGIIQKPFKAKTLAPIFAPLGGNYQAVVEISRYHYAKNRSQVALQISEWFSPGLTAKKIDTAAKKPKSKKKSKKDKSEEKFRNKLSSNSKSMAESLPKSQDLSEHITEIKAKKNHRGAGGKVKLRVKKK